MTFVLGLAAGILLGIVLSLIAVAWINTNSP
jgi:xanthosine utilization system XapX-like protein